MGINIFINIESISTKLHKYLNDHKIEYLRNSGNILNYSCIINILYDAIHKYKSVISIKWSLILLN